MKRRNRMKLSQRHLQQHLSKGVLLVLCIVTLVMSGGCSRSKSQRELEAYVQQIKSRKIKEIEPLPEVKPYETFTYADSDLRSPFVPSIAQDVARGAGDNGIRPDTNRRKEPLESFPLDSLRMVGSVEKDGRKWAIVVDTDGAVHRVTSGNFIGQNDGKIESITEEKMIINEIIPDSAGGWRERKASMALVEPAASKKTK